MPSNERLSQKHIFYRDLHAAYPVVTHGEGIYLYLRGGRRVIDGASGAAVVCLGHGNKEIVSILAEQAERVSFVHMSAFSNEPILRLSDYLHRITPGKLKRVYLVSGGSEANETALKLARAYHLLKGNTAKSKVISRSVSYHGSTIGALSMTGHHQRRSQYVPLLISFPRIPACYCYRCPFHLSPKKCSTECADDLERTIVAEGPETIMAFLVEPVIGASAPAVTPPPAYFRKIRRICSKYDVLLIADEVMTGCGRTGRFLAMEHFGVRADIATLSKGISSGYTPLGAVLCSGEIYECISQSSAGRFIHGNTFAGNPLSAAVGLYVVRTIIEKGYVERVARLGEYLGRRLAELRTYPFVGDVRCLGLLAGVEFVCNKKNRAPFRIEEHVATRFARLCFRHGLYVYPGSGSAGMDLGDHILLAPPYTITEGEIDIIIDILHKACRDFAAELSPPAQEACPQD